MPCSLSISAKSRGPRAGSRDLMDCRRGSRRPQRRKARQRRFGRRPADQEPAQRFAAPAQDHHRQRRADRKTDSRDFFQGILSASAQLARDPAAFSQKPGANLRDMGVLGEFLDDLLQERHHAAFRGRLVPHERRGADSFHQPPQVPRRPLRRVRRDVSNWESFGSKDPGDWVYRVPLAMLP